MDKFEPLENERWVWAKTFKDDYSHYLVSDMGRCWNCKTKQFVGTWYDGYWIVHLSKNGKGEVPMIGRLMLISFGIPIPEHLKDLPTSKLDAMHLDGDSHNNNLSNFAWGSRKENLNEINARIRKSEAQKCVWHSEEYRKKISEANKGKIGKDSPSSKSIIQYAKDGTFIRCWDSAMDVERELGIDHSNISKCCKGLRKYVRGYMWKYKEEAV